MRPPTTKQVCQAERANGQPCRAYAMSGVQWCYLHSPERAQEAQEARVAGGYARNKPAPAEPVSLRTIDDQIAAIEQTIDRVRAGNEGVNVARLVLYGISLARPLVELGEIEERIRALEGNNGKA
jgi:hypothetical protein